jgi:lysophospholipase L1-like esterase
VIRTWAAGLGTRERLGALVVAVGIGVSCIPASAGPVEAEAGAVQAYFFGDSLMGGTGASPRRPVMARMAAARLGWDVRVDEFGGTGYTTSGARPAYIDRMRAPGALSGTYDVVLVEGGTNDARSADDPERVREAVEEVVEEVRRRQPQAQIVLMGAYDPPAGGAVHAGRAVVDEVIEAVAEDEGLPFFSPLSGGWTQDQPASFLHPDRLHPTDEGYSVMGARLTEQLAALELRAVERE